MKLFSKRAFKRIAIGIGFAVGGLLALNGVLAWHASQRFESNIATIRAAGEPASLADLAPKAIQPDKNAAMLFTRIADELTNFEKEYDKFYDTPLGKDLEKRNENEELPSIEQLAAMRSILDAHPTILPALQQAAACDQYGSQLDFSLPPRQFLERLINGLNVVGHRTLARFVSWKIAVLQSEGKSDEAIRLGIQMLQLTRLWDHEPLLINYLVSLAVRGIMFESINNAMRGSQISSEVRQSLDEELALQDSFKPLETALSSERAFAISNVQEQTSVVPAFMRWPMMDFFFLKELDAENQACALAKLPLKEILPQWDPATKESCPPQLKDVKSRLIGTTIAAVFSAQFRYMTLARCLRVVNALEIYRERTGNDADRVEQLPLAEEATIDLYSGKPLRLKKTDRGWVVYSVWKNGVDDGGRFDMNDGDWGMAPLGYQHAEGINAGAGF